MTVGVPGFTFSGGTKYGRNIVLAFDIGLRSEVQIAPVGLRFASERVLQVLMRLGALELHDYLL
jgi:hypothetical protein